MATPDDWRGELIEGRLVMLPAPGFRHQALLMRLALRLVDHFGRDQESRVLVAPLDIVLDEHNVLQPDVMVFPEGVPMDVAVHDKPPPLWVAEILSPSTAKVDRDVKLPLYAAGGVAEAWLVDPRRRMIEVHDLAGGTAGSTSAGGVREIPRIDCGDTEIARSAILSGFAIDVGEFFGPAAPQS